MLKWLPTWLKGSLSLLFYIIYSIVLGIPVLIVSLLKLIFPFPAWRNFCRKILDVIAAVWLETSNLNHQLMGDMQLEVDCKQAFDNSHWYLVVANHQSWVDIFVLTRIFHKKIPMFRFFIKRSLLWIPIIGTAWWAMDFPIMRRYSSAQIKKNPKLAGRDLQASIRASKTYLHFPVSIVSFAEGTRFTKAKHTSQQSPYQHLLRPKAGGLSYVINAMQARLNTIIDVTIAYPDAVPGFWELMSGQVKRVKVHVQLRSVTEDLLGDYAEDAQYRQHFQQWLNAVWHEKDQQLTKLLP